MIKKEKYLFAMISLEIGHQQLYHYAPASRQVSINFGSMLEKTKLKIRENLSQLLFNFQSFGMVHMLGNINRIIKYIILQIVYQKK